MARITGPLLSQEAHGMVGERLVFSKRKTGHQARFQKAQVIVTPTYKQADTMAMYRVIYARWLSFSDSERQAYDDEAKAKNLKMSGWNYFFQLAFANPLVRLGLCGYWSMNRTGFGTVLDLSKNGNVGTLLPSWPDNSPQYVNSKNTKLLKALEFDGIDDYVDCGSGDSLDITGIISVEAWVNVSAKDNYDRIVSKENATDGYRYYFSAEADQKLNFSVMVGGAGKTAKSDDAFPTGVWKHIVGVYDKIAVKLYIDTVLQAAPFPYTGDYGSNALPLTIGRTSGGGNYLKGIFDEVRVYNRALSIVEIEALYNLFV